MFKLDSRQLKIRISWLSSITIALAAMCVFFSMHVLTANINENRQLTWSDAEGYYMYLPAVVIYKNFSDIPLRSSAQFKRIEKTNNYYDKYTFGTALMQLPFFTIADLWAKNSKHARDGYSRPYQVFLFFAALFYAVCGLIVLFKILSKNHEKRWVIITLLCLFFGTNLAHYSTMEAGMSHAFSFFLVAGMIYYTPKFYDLDRLAIIKLSIIVSLLVFIRPTNVFAALFIPFYQIGSKKELIQRIRFIKSNFLKFLVLVVPFVILSIVQIYFWSLMWGETVLYSYNTEPGFIFWMKPKFFEVLFSVQNGLFVYAPILLFALVGLIRGSVKRQPNFWFISVLFLLVTYVFASWWAWWFGGAYGHRCYVEYLPFLSIPMIYMFSKIWKSKLILVKFATVVMIFAFNFYSVQMTRRYFSPWDGPDWNWQSWFDIFKTIW